MRILVARWCSMFLVLGALYGSEAEYLGGTVKSIPKNMTGRLDLTDPSNLIFTYGKGVYRLPFEDIKSFEITPAKSPQHRLGVPVPRLPWSQQTELLNLSFRGEDHVSEVISFKLTGKDLTTTEWALKSRIEEPRESNTAAGRTKLPEAWWGDRYWRTTRNSTQAESAGTK